MTSPGINTAIETARNASEGPPTVNTDGYASFRAKPTSTNGNVSSAIVSPAPTSSLSPLCSRLA